jgi:hypothetical protein
MSSKVNRSEWALWVPSACRLGGPPLKSLGVIDPKLIAFCGREVESLLKP